MTQNRVCCFTGHRDFEQTVTAKQRLILEKLINNAIACGFTTFVAGGALGFDTAAAEYVLKKRREDPRVRLELVLPCADQDVRWSPPQKARYRKILAAADHTECLNEHYTDGCMYQRNRRMVEKSAVCIAFCQKTYGGSFFTVNYAKEKGLAVYNIPDMEKLLQ